MAPKNLENLNSSIVVLSGVEAKIGVSGEDLARIVKDPAVTQTPAGIEITSIKDQAVITVTEGKILFLDQSGKEPVLHRLPEIAHGFMSILRQQGVDQLRAYGLNFDVAFDCREYPTAGQAIADRFVNTEAIQKRGGMAVGGAGLKLFFDHAEAHCLLNIEPRFEKAETAVFFAHINYHYELDGPMPPLDELKLKYHGLWGHYKELLERLVG